MAAAFQKLSRCLSHLHAPCSHGTITAACGRQWRQVGSSARHHKLRTKRLDFSFRYATSTASLRAENRNVLPMWQASPMPGLVLTSFDLAFKHVRRCCDLPRAQARSRSVSKNDLLCQRHGVTVGRDSATAPCCNQTSKTASRKSPFEST